MAYLILKDILIQKKTFLYSVPYAFFAVAALSSSFTPRGAYMFGAMSIAYLFVMYSNHYDEKNKCEVMLNSLPIARKDIVAAKYLSLFMFAVFGILISAFAGIVIMILRLPTTVRIMNIEDIIAIVTVLGLMYSIYYPAYFKFGLLKVRIFNLFLYLFFLFMPNILMNLVRNNPENSFVQLFLKTVADSPSYALQAGILAGVLILLVLSFAASLKLYNKKDL